MLIRMDTLGLLGLPWYHWVLGRPMLLLLGAGILVVLLVLFWRSFRTRGWACAALVASLVWLGLFLLAWGVDTLGETLERRTAELAQAADRGQWPKVESSLLPGAALTDGQIRLEAPALRAMIERDAAAHVHGLQVWSVDIQGWDQQSACVRVSVAGDGPAGGLVTVDVQWAFLDKQWKIKEIKIIGVPGGQPMGVLRHWH